MKAGRGIIGHALLLALAVGSATYVWTRDESPKALVQADVTVWSGKPADIASLTYEAKTKKVTLSAKTDATGRFYVGSVEKDAAPAKPAGDAGAEPDAKAPERTTIAFVSVGGATKLLEDLAPLKAFRNVGKIGDDRAAEFGLAEPEGTLSVEVGGAARKLVVGGPTPGGADRYVRDEGTGEVFVIKGDIVRSLDSADSRLIERELHDWKDVEVDTAKITAAGKARAIVRGNVDGKKFWADAAQPSQNDETISNWVAKLDRLRPNEYVLTPPAGAESVVKVDYAVAGKPVGMLELFKVPDAAGGKPTYYLLTEHIRHHAKVAQTLAEQVEQDVGSIANQ